VTSSQDKYEHLLAKSELLRRKNVPGADLTDKAVEFLAGETGIESYDIRLLVLAHEYAARTGVPPEGFYGLLSGLLPAFSTAPAPTLGEMRWKLAELGKDPKSRDHIENQLEAMQRVFKVAPRYEAMKKLMSDGLKPADEIAGRPPEVFVDKPHEDKAGEDATKEL
jgi:hypothetical protein